MVSSNLESRLPEAAPIPDSVDPVTAILKPVSVRVNDPLREASHVRVYVPAARALIAAPSAKQMTSRVLMLFIIFISTSSPFLLRAAFAAPRYQADE
jgi:hypothetical protein